METLMMKVPIYDTDQEGGKISRYDPHSGISYKRKEPKEVGTLVLVFNDKFWKAWNGVQGM